MGHVYRRFGKTMVNYSVFTTHSFINFNSTASKKPQRVTIRQRGRARRPQQNTPQNTKPQTTETDKAQSAFPSFSAVEPTPVPTQATIQTQRPRASLATVQPTIQAIPLARRQSPRSFILPKESQGIYIRILLRNIKSEGGNDAFVIFPNIS